jgi:hypothetical protein
LIIRSDSRDNSRVKNTGTSSTSRMNDFPRRDDTRGDDDKTDDDDSRDILRYQAFKSKRDPNLEKMFLDFSLKLNLKEKQKRRVVATQQEIIGRRSKLLINLFRKSSPLFSPWS